MGLPRQNELTGVINRELFEIFPGIPKAEADIIRWRQFRERYHLAQQLKYTPPFPLQLDFELTSLCQLRCRFCIHGQEIIKKQSISWEDYTRIIDESEQYSLVSVKLNVTNEPLLTKDLPEYIRYAKKHGILNVYFATNGILLTEQMSRDLINAGVSKIMISLDATTSETYRLMRGSNKFNIIIKNIHKFLAIRAKLQQTFPLLRVNFLRTKYNLYEADDFISQWMGVADMIGFQRQLNRPGVGDDILAPLPTPNEVFRCSFPYKMLAIQANGNICPCCPFSGRLMPIGNIDNISIHDAWNHAKTEALRKIHLDGEYQSHPICSHCIGD